MVSTIEIGIGSDRVRFEIVWHNASNDPPRGELQDSPKLCHVVFCFEWGFGKTLKRLPWVGPAYRATTSPMIQVLFGVCPRRMKKFFGSWWRPLHDWRFPGSWCFPRPCREARGAWRPLHPTSDVSGVSFAPHPRARVVRAVDGSAFGAQSDTSSKAMGQACSAFCITLVSFAAGMRVSFSRAFASHPLAPRQKAETNDDDIRLATLSHGTAFTVLKSSWPGLVFNWSWQPQPAAIMEAVQLLISGIDLAVAALLSELILILGETGFLTPTAHGEPSSDGQPRRESVFALLQRALQLLTTAAISSVCQQSRCLIFGMCVARRRRPCS